MSSQKSHRGSFFSKSSLMVLAFFLGAIINVNAQNYTSTGNGSWTSAANWNNTSGWGAATPSTAGSSGNRTLNHDQFVTGNYSTASSNLTITAGSKMTVSQNFTTQGGSNTHVYGTLIIEGSMSLSGNFYIYPGGQVIVWGSVEVISSPYLNIGTATAGPSYSDMLIYGDLISTYSGDVIVNQNGRLGVFGSVNDSGGGGTFLRVQNGGQMYVHENINFSGGGSSIQNNNSTSPYGLYVNGTTTNTGGGSTTTTNTADQTEMKSSNPDFFNWLSSAEASPLPVVLIDFSAKNENDKVALYWSTASEQDNDYFTIEKSTDGQYFVEVDRVNGNGTSETKIDYRWVDYSLSKDHVYYRLSQTDYDGTTEVLGLKSIAPSSKKSEVSFYPNTAKSGGKITMKGMVPENVTILDVQGNVMHELNPMSMQVNLPELSSGMYFIMFQDEEQTVSKRLLIQ